MRGFIIGLLVGIYLGSLFGAFIIAACTVAKEADRNG